MRALCRFFSFDVSFFFIFAPARDDDDLKFPANTQTGDLAAVANHHHRRVGRRERCTAREKKKHRDRKKREMKVRTFIRFRVCVCVCVRARVCVSISLDYSVCVSICAHTQTKALRATSEGRERVGARKKEKRNDIQKFAFFWLTHGKRLSRTISLKTWS